MDNPKQIIRLPVKGHKQVRGVILLSFIGDKVTGVAGTRRSSYAAAAENDNVTIIQLLGPIVVEGAHCQIRW